MAKVPAARTAYRSAHELYSRARVLGDRARLRCLSAARTDLRLNVGAGGNHLAGWINLDLRPSLGSYGMDASREWPIASASAVAVNSEHMIEHLTPDGAHTYFAEAHRVLRAGGGLRTSTPDLGGLCELLLEGDPRSLDAHRSHGYAASTHSEMLNNYVYSWDHRQIYDFETLRLLLLDVGFVGVTRARFASSFHSLLEGIDRHDPGGLERSVLWVDAVKPGTSSGRTGEGAGTHGSRAR